jgi:arylsulfatase A-like enzyme
LPPGPHTPLHAPRRFHIAATLLAALGAAACTKAPQAVDLIVATASARRSPDPAAGAVPCDLDTPGPASKALQEASVAGRDQRWVLCHAGEHVRIDDVVRRTLPASPPSRLRFEVDIPQEGKLSLAMGLLAGEQEAEPIEFVVKVSAGGREEIVFTRVVDPASNPSHRSWVPAEVDLSRFAGRDRHLVLETRGFAHGAAHSRPVFWGDLSLTAPADSSPLLILYLVDTLRADHTTPYGYARDTTPHLSAFARDAVVFEQAISHSSWTKPSVASVFTSLLPGRHGTVQLRDPLDPRLVTLSEMLQAKGYSTGAVVANSLIYSEGANFEQGFDVFAGLHGEGNRPSKLVAAAGVVDEALRFLDARHGLATFLYVHAMDPHVPYAPPAPFDRMFVPHPAPGHLGEDPRKDYSEPSDRERLIAQYDGDIAYGDQEFGRFVAELKRRGLYDRALIVFAADHGEEFLDHGRWLHGLSVFDEVIKVPLIVKFPKQRSGGKRVVQQVQNVDILPTVLAAANLPLPVSAPPAGRPLQDALHDEGPERLAVSEVSQRGIVAYGVRSRTEKYVRLFSPAHAERFFDLAKDPEEKTDIFDRVASRLTRMRAAAEDVMAANSFRHAMKLVGTSRYELKLRTAGWFDEVESVGFGLKDLSEPKGGKLTLTVTPRLNRPREVSFVVRPAGAPVWMEGTRDGRPLAKRDVLIAADGAAPPALPVKLPEAETETRVSDEMFSPPRTGKPGVHLWLDLPPGSRRTPMDRETREQLCALGYVRCDTD